MSFKLKQETRQQLIAQERLYLNRDKTRVVGEGDKEAAFLFAAVGQPITLDDARRFKLIEEEVKGVEPETRSTRPARVMGTR